MSSKKREERHPRLSGAGSSETAPLRVGFAEALVFVLIVNVDEVGGEIAKRRKGDGCAVERCAMCVHLCCVEYISYET